MQDVLNYDFLVLVRCYTYNHSSYIEKTLDGFCMQQTSFPFICVIVDDNSTDGEQKIIKNYLSKHFNLYNDAVKFEETEDYVMTLAQHKDNLNCFFSVYYLKYNHFRKKSKKQYFMKWLSSTKYIALCEGDDYWIHPNKLESQVSFLENHQDYSMSFHKCFTESGRKFYSYPSKTILTAKDIILHHFIPAASLVYRTCYTKELKQFGLGFGDIPTQIQLSMKGKVFFLPEEMSVYRDNNPTSITHTRKQAWKGLKGSVLLYYYLLKSYPLNKYSFYFVYKLLRATILIPRNYIRLKRLGKL